MKYILVLAIGLFACNSSKIQEKKAETSDLTAYEQMIKNYQDSSDHEFSSGLNGVLTNEDLKAGKHLSFYAPNESYKVHARFERVLDGEVFEMPTSTDRLPQYRDYGILHFKLLDDSLQLHIYQSMDHPNYLFLPFKDPSNGLETYGAGRYLDFEIDDMIDPWIDFNYCYNPYCAYNYKYSCPIPPSENHLDVRIEAGVKKWK